MTEQYYDNVNSLGWVNLRMRMIEEHYRADHFKGKTLLEVGAAWGHIGKQFAEWGADVTCSDHYDQWVEKIQAKGLRAFVQNVNDPWDNIGHYDIIVHMGVLYHQPPDMAEPRLRDALQRCDELILESAADPKNSDPFYIQRVLHDTGFKSWQPMYTDFCHPTTAFIERIITDEGFQFIREEYSPVRFVWFCKK